MKKDLMVLLDAYGLEKCYASLRRCLHYCMTEPILVETHTRLGIHCFGLVGKRQYSAAYGPQQQQIQDYGGSKPLPVLKQSHHPMM